MKLVVYGTEQDSVTVVGIPLVIGQSTGDGTGGGGGYDDTLVERVEVLEARPVMPSDTTSRITTLEARPILPAGTIERIEQLELRPDVPEGIVERIETLELRPELPADTTDRLTTLEARPILPAGTIDRIVELEGRPVLPSGTIERITTLEARPELPANTTTRIDELELRPILPAGTIDRITTLEARPVLPADTTDRIVTLEARPIMPADTTTRIATLEARTEVPADTLERIDNLEQRPVLPADTTTRIETLEARPVLPAGTIDRITALEARPELPADLVERIEEIEVGLPADVSDRIVALEARPVLPADTTDRITTLEARPVLPDGTLVRIDELELRPVLPADTTDRIVTLEARPVMPAGTLDRITTLEARPVLPADTTDRIVSLEARPVMPADTTTRITTLEARPVMPADTTTRITTLEARPVLPAGTLDRITVLENRPVMPADTTTRIATLEARPVLPANTTTRIEELEQRLELPVIAKALILVSDDIPLGWYEFSTFDAGGVSFRIISRTPPVVIPSVGPVRNPSVAMGLNGIADWGASQPFIDVMRQCRTWEGRAPGVFTQRTTANLQENGFLDEDGWPIAMPPDCDVLSAIVLCDLTGDDIEIAGRYRVTWSGTGSVSVGGGRTGVTQGIGWIEFDYVPNGSNLITIDITATSASDPVREIRCIKTTLQTAYSQGEIFRPAWMDMIKDFRVVRFMDWQGTNNSTVSSWADRPRMTSASWSPGVPVEAMVMLANKLGTDPWFCIPHLADEDYITRFATYVRDNLNPKLRAHYEFSNEVWNFQFGQSQWALQQAEAAWPGVSDGWVQWYGGKSAEMCMILDEVYEGTTNRYLKVLGAHTSWVGVNYGTLQAPNWVAGAAGRQAPHTYHDLYALTGYFNGGLNDPANLPTVQAWRELGEEVAFTRLREQIIDGRHITTAADSTLVGMVDVWTQQKAIADEFSLGLVMYEGGSHIVPSQSDPTNDPDLLSFWTRFHSSTQMADIYTTLLNNWRTVGGQFFNIFVETSQPSRHGLWGHTRFVGDSANPRWQAIDTYNRTVPGPLGRGTSDFIGWIEGDSWQPTPTTPTDPTTPVWSVQATDGGATIVTFVPAPAAPQNVTVGDGTATIG